MTEITKDTSGLITQVKRNGIAVTVEIMKERVRPCLCIRFDGDPGIYKVASFDNIMKAQWFQDIMEEFFRDVEPNKPKPPLPPRQPGYAWDELVDSIARKRMDEVLKRIGCECSDEELAVILAKITEPNKLPMFHGLFMNGEKDVWLDWLRQEAQDDKQRET